MKPKDVGYPHELWTHKLLAKHIKKNCTAMGFPEASKISSGTISKILGASNIKPHKIASYIHQVLMPVEGKHPTTSRDYEYIRYGTLSLMAGIDLFTGVIHYKGSASSTA